MLTERSILQIYFCLGFNFQMTRENPGQLAFAKYQKSAQIVWPGHERHRGPLPEDRVIAENPTVRPELLASRCGSDLVSGGEGLDSTLEASKKTDI